ncbi:MAG: hypothetical protein AMXMBFR46_09130 [Acidimicrobiia bacterium]
MTIDERSRHALYLRLEQVLGNDEASTLMEHLPPVGWADVATRRDLDALRTDLVAEIAGVRSELSAEIAGVRSELSAEIAGVRSELSAEIAGVRSELSAENVGLAADSRSIRVEMQAMEQSLIGLFRMELAQAISAQTRTMVVTMITLFVTGVSLAFASARLG